MGAAFTFFELLSKWSPSNGSLLPRDRRFLASTPMRDATYRMIEVFTSMGVSEWFEI